MLSERSVTMLLMVHLLSCRHGWSWFRCCCWTCAWFRCCRTRLGRGFADSPAGAQAGDFVSIESEFIEYFLVVFAEFRCAFRRHFGDTLYLHRTADRGGQLATCAFERNDDVIYPQLRIVDDLLRAANRAE